ncbi:unnamed protein product, partial [Adineta ricciae]
MKRLPMHCDDLPLDKRVKLSSVVHIKNELDLFREQQPVLPSASQEIYITKPLIHSIKEENEIFNTLNNTLPVEYQSWENLIIRHSNAIKPVPFEETAWIPSHEYRTMAAYQKEILGRNTDYMENLRYDDRNRITNWYSIFPLNDAVILKNLSDNQNFQFDLNHKLKYVNPQQDLTVTELAIEPSVLSTRKEKVVFQKKIHSFKHNKESRLHRTRNVLARVGLSGFLPDNHNECYSHNKNYNESTKSKTISFWNLSNDLHYDDNCEQSFVTKRQMNSSQNLDFVFYPVFRTVDELRCFHRPLLRSIDHQRCWIPIQFINIATSDQSIRVKSDLTARFGEILLFEYSEQYPVLLNESGMFSKIRIYLRPQHFKADTKSHEIDYGELVYTHASPFLWSIPRGFNVQTIENNMFIAPIYRQTSSPTDFLVIYNTKDQFYIRNIDTIHIVGQQCPLIEVPIPQSKRVNLFQRDLLQIYIYRLFLQSNERPRRIRIEDIKRVFPRLAESSIRKRLKTSADFRRTGNLKACIELSLKWILSDYFSDDCNSWILKNDFRLPTEDEMRDLIKPEYCCAYASMVAAEQRLKDAGLCDKHNVDFDNYDEEDDQFDYPMELNNEILEAPWNTTRAYLGALKGKYLMQAFSIGSRTIQRTKTNNDMKHLRRAVTGTDADLRRLQLKDARRLLLKFNISEKIIQSLTRWEIVDLIRTLSTHQAKEGISDNMVKFARGAKHFQAQQFEKYKENCQKQFELQNR